MAVISSEESREAHNFAALSKGGSTNQQHESLREPYEVEIPITTNCQSHFNLKMMNNADNYVPYILDINVEKEKLEAPKCAYATANLKTEDCLTNILQREITSQLGGKLMQFLMNNSVELPKFATRDKCVTEKTCDTLTNRLRKYKRSASFNSRRVVLLFSILSIMGTIILIYLTLRVRQIGDGADSV